MRRTSTVKLTPPDASSHPLPQPPIATLRPRLAKAQSLFMSAAALEPQWLRGGWGSLVGRQGCYWFDTGAWGKAAGCLQLLLTRWACLISIYAFFPRVHLSVTVAAGMGLAAQGMIARTSLASFWSVMNHSHFYWVLGG
jgi:hypothetical protein